MSSDRKVISNQSKNRILNDYILMDIFEYSDIKDLFRWIRISQQFFECIHRVMKLENQLMVVGNEKFVCKTYSYKLLLNVRQSDSHRNEFRVTNIKSAIIKKSYVYHLNQSLGELRTISDKFQRIQYLTLQSCYLEESVLKFMEEYMSSLKYLLIEYFYFSKSQFVMKFIMFCKNLRNLTKNVTHLTSLTPIYFIEDKSEVEDSFRLSFIFSFRNLKQLRILVNKSSTIKQLFERLSSDFEDLFVCSYNLMNSKLGIRESMD